VLNVHQVITLFIIKLDYVLLTNQMIVITMKKKINSKDVILLVEDVKEKEIQLIINVQFALNM